MTMLSDPWRMAVVKDYGEAVSIHGGSSRALKALS